MEVVEVKGSPGYVWERKSMGLANEKGSKIEERRKRNLETFLRLWLVQTRGSFCHLLR